MKPGLVGPVILHQGSSTMSSRPQWIQYGSAGVLLTVAVALVYFWRMDNVVGLFKDDAWYLLLAKSLATGQGYRLTNFPFDAGIAIYPPAFPWLLSLFYRLLPEFPQNLWLLKSVSIIALLVTGWMLVFYFTRQRQLPVFLSCAIALATVLSPALVFLATSTLMSECVFTCIQVATLIVIPYCEKDKCTTRFRYNALIIIIAMLATATFFTRSIGITLVVAIGLFWAIKRFWKQVAVFAIAVACLYGPWWGYTTIQRQQVKPNPQSGTISTSYTNYFLTQETNLPPSYSKLAKFSWGVWQNLTVTFGCDLGGVCFPSLYRPAPESGVEIFDMVESLGFGPEINERTRGTMGRVPATIILSLVLSLIGLIGFIDRLRQDLTVVELYLIGTFAIFLAWPWSPFRFLLPLIPFLLFYIVHGWRVMIEWILNQANRPAKEAQFMPARVFLLCVIGLFMYDHVGYLQAKTRPATTQDRPPVIQTFAAIGEILHWVRTHTAETEVVTTDNLPLVYIYSHRKTIVCPLADCPAQGVRYFVNVAPLTPVPRTIPGKIVFQPNHSSLYVFEMSKTEKDHTNLETGITP